MPKDNSTRFQGYKRGFRWRQEPPQAYGITRQTLTLPLWFRETIGYFHPTPFFAVYADKRWFNGKEDGEGSCVYRGFETIASILDIEDGQCVLFVLADDNKWHTYTGDETRVNMWMELLAKDYPSFEPSYEANADLPEQELLQRMDTLMSDLLAQQNRLSIWLTNTNQGLTIR